MRASNKNILQAATTLSDPRWTAVVARDASADGTFYYSVSTTGVYCRPSCASRPACPESIAFHHSIEDAERAGFRPCKRCKPDQPTLAKQHAATVTKICQLIENSEKILVLDELAQAAGMSSYYLHRIFKATTGLTPKAYSVALRAKRLRNGLSQGSTVTDAIFEAGYNSNSRFYEKSNHILGMTPSNYQAGGSETAIMFAIDKCSLGSVLVASSERGVCAIFLGNDSVQLAHDLQDQFPHANLISGDNDFEQRVAQVISFTETPALGLDLPLDIRGTVFQQRVWQALREIPAGAKVSYTDIAQKIGSPRAVRAVAGACAANALAVAIPCHRVVRSDGTLSGYRWGVERKRALLALEAK